MREVLVGFFFLVLGSIGGGMVMAENDQEVSGTKSKFAWKTPTMVAMMLLLLLL